MGIERLRTGRSLRYGVLVVLLLLSTACAEAPGAGPGRDHATSDAVVPSSGSGSGEGQPLGGLGDPVDVSPGAVVIRPSDATYEGGQVIRGVVANGLDRIIYVEDSLSDCSIVLLERRDDEGWHPLLGCAVRRPPVSVAIGPSRGRSVAIDPASANFAVTLGPDEVPLGSGKYRLTLTYRFDPDSGGQARVAHSPMFEIS